MQEHRNKCVPSDENQGISDMRLRLVLRGFVLAVVFGAVLLPGCASLPQRSKQRETVSPSSMTSPPPVTSTAIPSPTATRPAAEATATVTQEIEAWKPNEIPSDEDLRSFVNQMPLADKIGQMMMVGFPGQSLSESPELSALISCSWPSITKGGTWSASPRV
jgi:hypothetical protein